jgi:hypothetical protein
MFQTEVVEKTETPVIMFNILFSVSPMMLEIMKQN